MDVTDMNQIEKAAKLLLKRFGEDAPAQVEMRINELKGAHEAEAVARWQLIARHLRTLLSREGHT